MKKRIGSSWRWYAVKLLFLSTISGEPNKDKIDEHYEDKFNVYEERIIVVKAQSSEHAYKKADEVAKQDEIEYYNPYDQLVSYKFVDSLNCQHLFDDEIKSGTEIYSRLFKVPVEVDTQKVIEINMPEVHDSIPNYNFLIG